MYIYSSADLDFGSILQTLTFDVNSGPGTTECVEIKTFSDGVQEGPEDFIVFIFTLSESDQIKIIPERMVKHVTIIEGECASITFDFSCYLLLYFLEYKSHFLCIKMLEIFNMQLIAMQL